MRRLVPAFGVLAATTLSACADPNYALFFTNSSLGINFDSKPPTANVAYDRTEGFIGPRFENGGAPPAVASMETDGNLFNPMVRQTYATGAAAVGATSGQVPSDAPQGLAGDPAKRKLMYFGTETTFGFKVGFAVAGAAAAFPDSFLFGYRRKEASVIPIAETQKDGVTKGTYPSVLASIRVNIKTANTDPNEVGLRSKQYFATGAAAEALSTNGAVRDAFLARAQEAAASGLTAEQIREARTAGVAAGKAIQIKLNKITEVISKDDGSLDVAALDKLVTAARTESPAAVPANLNARLKEKKTVGAIRDFLFPLEATVNALFNATQPKT